MCVYAEKCNQEICDHMLYNCIRYNIVAGDTLVDIIGFLQDNPDASCFQDNIS